MIRGLLTLFFSLLFTLHLLGQDKAYVNGTVTDENGSPLVFVNVALVNSASGTTTDDSGKFNIEIESNKEVKLGFSYTGYETLYKDFFLGPNEITDVSIILKSKAYVIDSTITVVDKSYRTKGISRLDPKIIETIPSTTGGVESILKTLPSVSSNSELSSQYSVRGGNFDENLVYVNDFEIYRPFLIRSGQQEGLSFINPNMVNAISFSAGGFEARYGDKMSSVLDISYRKPKEFKGSIEAGLLTNSGHLQGVSKLRNFSWQLGIRQKSNQLLLNSLPTEGEYNPNFLDVQTLLTYDFSPELQLQYLGNIARNRYSFVPTSNSTSFGLLSQTLTLLTFFEGQEVDKYNALTNGLSLRYIVNKRTTLKLLSSHYYTNEKENFDIIGYYRIGEANTDAEDENFQELDNLLGVGTLHNYARNKLTANIFSLKHLGSHERGKHFIEWGATVKSENIEDKINEWTRIDSSGFSIPSNGETVQLSSVLKTKNTLNSLRYSAYAQDTWSTGDSSKLSLTLGTRLGFWDVNKEFLISPRAQISFIPNNYKLFGDDRFRRLMFRFSGGIYNQPPFYREMRRTDGTLNLDLVSQKSAHAVLGVDYEFSLWERKTPFKFTSEIFYKGLWDLVPYDIDNVLIRYFGDNLSKGYAAGIEMRVNGEFVPGTESWFSLAVSQTNEDIINDFYIYNEGDSLADATEAIIASYEVGDSVTIGSIPRPTDQRLRAAILFQDNIPGREDLKMHLNLVFGSGLPFGPPMDARNRNVARTQPYRRVDIGFSAKLFDSKKRELPSKSVFRKFDSIWTSLEVFNVLGVKNTISYLWIDDIFGRTWGVPNFLTSRRLNARLIVKFGKH